jgi:hypothetical protein
MPSNGVCAVLPTGFVHPSSRIVIGSPSTILREQIPAFGRELPRLSSRGALCPLRNADSWQEKFAPSHWKRRYSPTLLYHSIDHCIYDFSTLSWERGFAIPDCRHKPRTAGVPIDGSWLFSDSSNHVPFQLAGISGPGSPPTHAAREALALSCQDQSALIPWSLVQLVSFRPLLRCVSPMHRATSRVFRTYLPGPLSRNSAA